MIDDKNFDALEQFNDIELAGFNHAIQLAGIIPKRNISFKKAVELKIIDSDGNPCGTLENIQEASARIVNMRIDAAIFGLNKITQREKVKKEAWNLISELEEIMSHAKDAIDAINDGNANKLRTAFRNLWQHRAPMTGMIVTSYGIDEIKNLVDELAEEKQ